MRKIGRLELTWTGKYEGKKIEPRILVEDKEKSYGDSTSKNMLIHGDNLIALKALETDFAGKVKCVYIDPPFNTGQAFENYDDDMEHSIWLDLMARRLRIIYNLLEENGLLWVHLDDTEVHYCKVLLDEIFTRRNFVSHITYERSAVAGIGQGGFLVNTTEHILLYKKGILPNKNNQSYEELGINIMKRYNKYVSNFGTRKLVREFLSKSNGKPVRIFKHINFAIKSISLKNYSEREKEIRGEFAFHLDTIFRGNRVQKENEFQNDIISDFKKDGFYSMEYIPSRGKNEGKETTLFYYNRELLSWLKDTTLLTEEGMLTKSTKMTTLWKHGEIPKADIANEGGVYFPRGKKPEQLLRRIIEISTNPGDLVLDSFLGSGTTAAVAHKLGRQWIGIEMGEQAYTHCKKRLDYVIDGDDQLGISKAVNWQGGGGYHFYELAPSLLVKNDKLPVYQINPTYTFDMLCEAICKIEGFKYKSQDVFCGHSSEKRFIHVTTEFVNAEYIRSLSQHLDEDQSLLVYAMKIQSDMMLPDNIEVKIIPKDLLDKCSFESEVR